MGIENITERIISDAQAKAAEIESGSDNESAKIRDEAGKKAESIKSQIIADAKSQAGEEKRRILAFARLEARNSVLAEKQKVIGQIFDNASKELQSLPDREYEDLIKKLLIKATVTGEEEIIFSSRDKKRISDKMVSDVNAALKADGKKGNLKISQETREIEGGFILKAEGVEINNSFSSLLNLLREELEYKLLEILS